MNGEQATGANFFKDTLRSKTTASESFSRRAASFMHPREVVDDLWLTPAEKREVLASWASDAHAVPDAPALRQLVNGAVVRVDDVLRALASLDDRESAALTTSKPFRRPAGLSIRLPTWVRSALRRSWPDDDDDPPPCPVMIARPRGGPLSGGGTADPGLALAA